MVDFLRIYLLSGLVLHKAVWEILRKSSVSRAEKKPTPIFSLNFLMKFAKVILLLVFILQIIFMHPIIPVADQTESIVIIGLFLYTAGLIVAITGRIQLGSNWSNIEEGELLADQKLVNHGIYRYIRHPIYAGDALLVLGLELALNSWLWLIIFPLSITILNRAKSEERILIQSFSEYKAYQQQTKMFIPFIF